MFTLPGVSTGTVSIAQACSVAEEVRMRVGSPAAGSVAGEVLGERAQSSEPNLADRPVRLVKPYQSM